MPATGRELFEGVIQVRVNVLLALVAALLAAILFTGCGGGGGNSVTYDPRFLTVASSPNPPSDELGWITPSGAGGDKYLVGFDPTGPAIQVKLVSSGMVVMNFPTGGRTVLAISAQLDEANSRFDISTIEDDGNIYNSNMAPGVLIGTAAGCKYVAVDGSSIIASLTGELVDATYALP